MNPHQEVHLKEIKFKAIALIDSKYRKGQAEHGGNLWDMTAESLIDEAINESIDQIVYLLTAKEKIKSFKKYALQGSNSGKSPHSRGRAGNDRPVDGIRSPRGHKKTV